MKAKPRKRDDAIFTEQIDIVFDRATGFPKATRTVDASGSQETVYAAMEIELDGQRPPVKALKKPTR